MTIHNSKVTENISVVVEPTIENMAATVRIAIDDKTVTIVKNVVAEDVVAIVDTISNWVPVHNGTATDVASIVDIAAVGAVVAVVHCAVNDDAMSVEGYGGDKLMTTINNTMSINTCTTLVLWDTDAVVVIYKDFPVRTRTSFHTHFYTDGIQVTAGSGTGTTTLLIHRTSRTVET